MENYTHGGGGFDRASGVTGVLTVVDGG